MKRRTQSSSPRPPPHPSARRRRSNFAQLIRQAPAPARDVARAPRPPARRFSGSSRPSSSRNEWRDVEPQRQLSPATRHRARFGNAPAASIEFWPFTRSTTEGHSDYRDSMIAAAGTAGGGWLAAGGSTGVGSALRPQERRRSVSRGEIAPMKPRPAERSCRWRRRSPSVAAPRGADRPPDGQAPPRLQALDPRQQRPHGRVHLGRAAFTSASSSCVRASAPARTASSASPSSSSRRTTVRA